MAITTSGVYWLSVEKFLTAATGIVSWESTACKYALALDASTPNFDLHDFRNDFTEATGTGYTAGGNALVSPALTISAGMKYDFNDPQWTTSTIASAMAGVVCSGNATNTIDETHFLQDFVTAVSTTAGTLDVAIHANGALTFA